MARVAVKTVWEARPAVGLRITLVVAAGLVTSAAFPPLDLGSLAFIALVPLFLALAGTRPRRAVWLGYLYGLSFFVATIHWVINSMTTYGHMPLPLAVVAMLLLAAVLAGYSAAFTGLLRAGETYLSLPVPVWPVMAALLWVGLEIARGWLLSGFPWALLGYTQYRQPTVRLLASAAGVYGVSALLVLVNSTIARLLLGGLRGWRRPDGWAPAGLTLLALLATAGHAWAWRDPTGGAPIRIGLVQGNIDQSVKWDPRFQGTTLDTYARLVRQVAAEHPALIVWPETAVPFFLRYEPALAARVFELSRETGIPMLVGSPDVGVDQRLYNSVFLILPDGAIHGRYDKHHLVPFGEYVPLHRLFFFLDKLVVGIGDFGRGRERTVFSLDGLRFSVMICYEVIFPDEVRAFAERGAQLLVNITNDAWFGRSGAPRQHLAMAVLRAVENGSYLVRAANTGITAVIDPAGAIQAETDLFTEAALSGTVRARQVETIYTRYGGMMSVGGAAFLVGYILVVASAVWMGRGRVAGARRSA